MRAAAAEERFTGDKGTGIVARMTDALQVEVPVRWIFETPTVAGLAARIEARGLPWR